MIRPRIMSVPASSGSLGREAVELAASVGVHLDEWQAFVLEQSMGVRGDGKWAAFEVAVNVARQNGKNEIMLARELAGLFLLGEDLIIHSAHEFKTSTEHQRRIEMVVQDNPSLHRRVKPNGYRHSHGEESIELRSGQRIRFMTRTKGGGRGHTGDLVMMDEAMILPAAMIGALMPTMSARSVLGNPQMWYGFTAVDQMIHDHGLVAARLRERALAGGDPSLAYFEWSHSADAPWLVTDQEAQDEAVWAVANPALGIRISAEHVANERRSMDPRTFAVERLGVGDYPAADGSLSVIDAETWVGLADAHSKISGSVAFALDVTPDRSYSAICSAGLRSDERRHIEVVQHERGTHWVVEALTGYVQRNDPIGVFIDSISPAASLIPALEEAGIEVTLMNANDNAKGCGMFYDLAVQDQLRHLGTTELSAAVRGAVKRPLGDAWAWSRKNSAIDISPLVACTLALYGFETGQAQQDILVAYG